MACAVETSTPEQLLLPFVNLDAPIGPRGAEPPQFFNFHLSAFRFALAMDDELQEILRKLIESPETSLLVVGDDIERRVTWARAMLSAREGLGEPVFLKSADDWEGLDDEVEAVVVPDVTAASDREQGLLLEWLTEGTRVVAAGASDPDGAVREGELRADLFYRLAVAPFPVGEIDTDVEAEAVVEQVVERDDDRGAGSQRAMPSAAVAEWCQRAGVAPVRSWRHTHLEEGDLWTLEVGASATEAWHRLRETSEPENGVPVVTPGREVVDELLERQHFEHERISARTSDWRLDDWRRAAESVDLAHWIDETIEREIAEGRDASFFEAESWELVARSDEEASFVDRGADDAAVTIVPVDEAWEVPAFFHFGGYVGTPSAHLHAAIMKYWADNWGARVSGIGADMLDVYLDEPLRDRDEVLEVAREYFAYCPPSMGDDITDLARRIDGAHWWFFWWD